MTIIDLASHRRPAPTPRCFSRPARIISLVNRLAVTRPATDHPASDHPAGRAGRAPVCQGHGSSEWVHPEPGTGGYWCVRCSMPVAIPAVGG